jgi:hypothetical protein
MKMYCGNGCIAAVILKVLRVNSHSSSPKIPHLLWNPKVQYRVHLSPPLVTLLSQTYTVRTDTSYFLRSVLILSSHLRLGLSNDLFPVGLPTKGLYAFLISHTCTSSGCGWRRGPPVVESSFKCV